MYCPSRFRETRPDVLQRLVADHPLATLITAGRQGLLANLIPFSFQPGGEHGTLRAHLARANPQAEALREAAEVLVLFQGPAAYVTPAWYPSRAQHGKVVPTWNYVMVQARGKPRVVDDAAWLHAQVDALTRQQESRRLHPWQVADAPPDFIAAQLGAIFGLEIPIAAIEGKWKLSQNRQPADREGVRQGLKTESACPSMAGMMEGQSGS